MRLPKKIKANISLITVLVTTMILLLGGIVVIMNSIDLSHSAKDSFNGIINEMHARSCVEEGLVRIKKDVTFTGQFTITFTDGSCTNVVTTDSPTTVKKFTISSNASGYNLSLIKKVDTSVDPFVILQ
jgi:hypothetical protein